MQRGLRIKQACSAILLFLVPVFAEAIATASRETSETPPTEAGFTFDWNHVYRYKGASGVAVDHFWILTAAHVADDLQNGDLMIDGQTNVQREIVYHSSASDPDGHADADLALVRFTDRLPGYYPLATSAPQGTELIMCGFGLPGDVIMERNTAYFTTDSSGTRARRWGTNCIDRESEKTYAGPAPLGTTSNQGFETTISTSRQSAKKTAYEAGANLYDSGAGMFVQEGETWKLAGTITLKIPHANGEASGNFAVSTHRYANWIRAVIVDYDTDMDGLPDWWEEQHEVDELALEPGEDSDLDGHTNFEEWITDTDPKNPDSMLWIDTISPSNLVFSSSENREYALLHCPDLTDTNAIWEPASDWLPGAPGQTVLPLPPLQSKGFFRVSARLP